MNLLDMDSKLFDDLILRQGFDNVSKAKPPFPLKRGLVVAYTFSTLILDVPTKIMIGIDARFPLSLPQYFIVDYENYEFIPHVEPDGRICYIQEDYLYIDAERPAEIIQETFSKARLTVEQGLGKENWFDFTLEFESYWQRQQKKEIASFNGILGKKTAQIKVGNREDQRFIVTEEGGYIQSGDRFFTDKGKGIVFQNAIYIPLEPNHIILPPKYKRPLSYEYVIGLIKDNISDGNNNILGQLTARKSKAEEYVIFSIIQDDGATSLFGVKFNGISDRSIHPLESPNFSGKITAVFIQRLDKAYMYNRGSNGISLEKKGLIIGGGSVGGFIAEELVRSGFFDLTIVDGDNMSIGNCYRHLVGFAHFDRNKAEALKIYLERKFPHCNIIAKNSRIESLIIEKKIDISDYDFIIVATGNVTINIFFNKYIQEKFHNIPVMYCWNDPYGIGGHCLVTNIKEKGCYQCLYQNVNKANSASFADVEQPKTFLKSASGCDAFYTPYGSADSMQTSLLAIRKLVDVLLGTEKQNVIYSWKGDGNVFIREGYKPSPRFYMSEQEIEQRKYDFIDFKCQVCSKKPR